MATTIQEERWRWLKPIIEKETRLVDVAKVCPHSERSLKRWKSAYKKEGLTGLVPKSTEPKHQPNETPIRIKEEVITLRKKTRLCAKKLHWKLKKEGLVVPERTIGKILKDEGLVRKYRVRKITYKYIRAQRQPGELVEIDVKYVPGMIAGKRYYQYTAIDTASRWRYLKVYEEQSTYHSIEFLKEVMKLFPYPITGVKTDNRSIFTNYYTGTNKRSDMTVKTLHALDLFCAGQGIVHYLIDPGKPAQNGTVERSHREDQEKFYERNIFRSMRDLEKKIRIWNEYYNNLEHCGLNGKTPNEMLEFKVTEVVA
ncbi:MAG: integrase core domain-containing protein [Minisyncoccota bacterium]